MDKKTVETNVNEAVKEQTEKKEVKLPKSIWLRCKGPDSIYLSPVGETMYKKEYVDSASGKTRREKMVALPQNRDGITFGNVWSLFKHLRENCGYEIVLEH